MTANCVFYMWFVPKYILILLVTIIIDYSAGLLMERDADSPILPIGLSFHTFQSMTRSKSALADEIRNITLKIKYINNLLLII